MQQRTILFATDYSEASQHALPFACSLARDLDATLVIAHVSEHHPLSVGEAGDVEVPPSPLDMARLRKVRPLGDEVRHEYQVIYAEPSCQTIRPAEEIIRYADKIGAYAIFVGTHGRTGLGRVLMGSTAEELVRHAHCPVVSVRCPGETSILSAHSEGEIYGL